MHIVKPLSGNGQFILTGLKREGGTYLHNIYTWYLAYKSEQIEKTIYETDKKLKLILTNNLLFTVFCIKFSSRVKYCFRVGKSIGMCSSCCASPNNHTVEHTCSTCIKLMEYGKTKDLKIDQQCFEILHTW